MATVETLGKYEIKRQLGKGAMGTVYEGWDPIIERRVAIKTVSLPDSSDPETEEALARFRREAQAAGRLTHPNIVGVFDYGETSDLAYIVMEFVDGPPLKNLLDKQERFTVADTVRIMDDLLAGLKFSHDRGVVHRDIKPANLMLTSSGQAKIADFGIARIESSSMTQAGTVMGTPAYMSPEQIMGQVVDARSDIYSSGVLLYQLLTGERPFEGGMSAIMHKALNTDAPLPSQISVTAPTSFDAVVRKAMAKRPEERFADAAAFANAIRDAAAGRGSITGSQEPDEEATLVASPRAAAPAPAVAAAPPADRGRPQAVPRPLPTQAVVPPKKSKMPLIIGGMAAALSLVGGVGWFLLNGGAPSPNSTASSSPAPAAPPITVQPSSRAADTPTPPPARVDAAPVARPQADAASLDSIRRQIIEIVTTQRCATIEGDITENGPFTVKGIASESALAELQRTLSGLAAPTQPSWGVTAVKPEFCPTLDILRPITRSFGSTGARLGLDLINSNLKLRDGDHIRPRLMMPDFRGQIRADYIAHDGTVLHLYPQVADTKQGMAADPSARTFAPGEALNLGEVGPGHPAWEVAPPYGQDMIVAIASAQPLFERGRQSNVEKADDYLRDLRAAIETAQQKGVRLIGSAIVLETTLK